MTIRTFSGSDSVDVVRRQIIVKTELVDLTSVYQQDGVADYIYDNMLASQEKFYP